MRSLRVIVAAPALLLLLGGCGDAGEEGPPEPRNVTVSGTFGTEPVEAITYSQDLVRTGARAWVSSRSADGSSTVVLAVRGLLPGRVYGAHVHQARCGADGDAAGPHFQHQPDPIKPSTDPAFANPSNEVWLDVTTDGAGDGSARSTVPWEFSDRRPQSVVLHEQATRTGPGEAGTAGHRAACINVDF